MPTPRCQLPGAPHTPASNSYHHNKTRQRILQPSTLLQDFVFPGWEHQEYHAHIWTAPPSHYPKRKGQPHFWYVEPHNQHKHKLLLAELPGDCCDLQLTHRQPAPFLDHPGCGSHSPPAFGTATAEAGVFVKFPPPPISLCAWPNSCLALCPLAGSINGGRRKEGGHRALGGRGAQPLHGNASNGAVVAPKGTQRGLAAPWPSLTC